MKILYRILFLTVFLGLVPLSCDKCIPKDSCDCQPAPPKSPDFEITEMDATLFNISPQEPIDTALFHLAKDITLGVSVSEKRDVVFHPKSKGFSFQQAAYACSPIPGRSIQSIQNVSISAAQTVTYDSSQDTINFGDSITSLFGFARNSPSSFYSLNEFLGVEPRLNAYGSFYIRLNSSPYQPTTLIIDVEVTLSDGQIFKFEDEILKVK